MCGESSSIGDNVCSEWHHTLSTLLKNYEPQNVLNTDETALFFKCLPDKTFTFKFLKMKDYTAENIVNTG